MGTWPWEAPIGMQQTVLVFVLSPCTQLSDLGFEIIRLIFLKKNGDFSDSGSFENFQPESISMWLM